MDFAVQCCRLANKACMAFACCWPQMSVTRRVLTRLSLSPTSSFNHHITHTRTLTHTLTHTNNTSDTLNERIIIKNSQRKFPIDIDLTKKHISKILDILKMPNFGVYLLICSDAKMREINKNLRQKSKSTDILSYSLPEGAYDPLSGNKEGHSYLGTLVICPAFVNRQMLADKEAFEHDDLDLSEDAGVSRAMATVFSVQKRFPYLLAHGIIHLTGYDHENDEDWLRMTQKEDEVLRALAVEFPSCILSPPL